MLIGEVMKLTKIPRKTIYFYIEQGLIDPQIAENGYRHFSATDVAQLEKITALRAVDVSIKNIQIYIKNIEMEKEILQKQLVSLVNEKQEVSGKIEVCQRLIKNNISDFIGKTIYPNMQSIQEFPLEIGESNTRWAIIGRLSIGVLLGGYLSLMLSSYLPVFGRVAIVLLITTAMLPFSFQYNTMFMDNGFFYQPDQQGILQTFVQPIYLLFAKETDKRGVFVTYTDVIDAEVVWRKEPTMKGWTVPKVWISIHTKQHGIIRLDVLTIDNLSEKIPQIMMVFADNGTPIFDPHRIIGAMEQGIKLSTYIDQLVFSE